VADKIKRRTQKLLQNQPPTRQHQEREKGRKRGREGVRPGKNGREEGVGSGGIL